MVGSISNLHRMTPEEQAKALGTKPKEDKPKEEKKK